MAVARARKKRNRVPHCCGKKMLYKDSYGIYVCDVCGKEKRVKREQKHNGSDMDNSNM